ncbi:hypothetical protein Tco_0367133 [Tanacetum coccineum]
MKNLCENFWITKTEKLENENVSLGFQVQSLIKERENVKLEYQNLFDSIKKTRTQIQWEIDELIENVNQKTYAYADVRAQNQDLFITISELKVKLKMLKNGCTRLTIDFVHLQTQGIKLLCKLNTRNQAVVQAGRVNIQSINVGNNGRSARRFEKGHYAHNCPKTRVRDSKYFMEQMLLEKKDEARVILSNEQNDFLLADTVQMEELEELSANTCMMARIQPAHIDSDEGPSYDYAFISEVQTSSTSYMNPLFTDNDHEQEYHEQPKIINSTISDDQINSDIIFDNPNVEVNNGSVDHDKHVHDSYELEQLARNAYKEAEKQQIIANKVKQQNVELTKQLEQYKERV